MFRFIRNAILAILCAAIAAAGIFMCTSPDPFYALHEILGFPQYHRYDALITEIGHKYGVDPMLIKAVVWRESAFRPEKVGKNGERGLMQVTEAAARDWARQEKRPTFVPTDLFSPRINIEAGTWYLKKALAHYTGKDDPMTFALAEYNAGKSRVDRWLTSAGEGQVVTAQGLHDLISFPGTRDYVDVIMDRYRFYKRQGHL
jgi:soluble lytic murein transglycosylase